MLSFFTNYGKLGVEVISMLENVEVLCHNCIKFNSEKIIYTDPFQLKNEYHDADMILITHSHYDHFSEEDIEKVRGENTVICITEDLYDKILELNFQKENIVVVKPNHTYQILGIEIETIPAYNTNKKFHPKENQWVGYLLHLQGNTYYIAGDTDITEENRKIICDVAFVPVGGTYTMGSKEAAELVNEIKPRFAVPVHYGSIVGEQKDAELFIHNLSEEIKGRILMK